MKTGSITTINPRLLESHSCSLSQTNPNFRRFKSFSKTLFPNSYPFIITSPLILSSSCCVATAKKKTTLSEPLLTPSIVDEVSEDDYFEDFDGDEGFEGDDEFQDDYSVEDAEPRAGDGGGGGGISLAGTTWDKEALAIAEQVSASFDEELGIYAFKTLQNSAIRVRIERLSNKSGSPTMEDIEAFSSAYRERLNEAEVAGSVPDNISLEVSSPGLERVIRIPQDLERFKDRPMYVRYAVEGYTATPHDGVFRLESFDVAGGRCTWSVADVRVNRKKAGKGRPLNKKQREWRFETPFESLVLVRVYVDL